MTAPIALTIVGGYLGAGKTTLINALLKGDQGRALAIIVNDFGSINIDAELIANRDGETISLANGCICCSMTDDLATTLIALCARETPPDHILIETSGVAEPAKVAAYAGALPGLRLEAVIVVVDAETITSRAKDKFVGSLVLRQIEAADLIVMSKLDLLAPDQSGRVMARIAAIGDAPIVVTEKGTHAAEILIGADARRHAPAAPHAHPHAHTHDHRSLFTEWSFTGDRPLERAALLALLASRPRAFYRIKGVLFLADDPERRHILQVVGNRLGIEAGPAWAGERRASRIVAIAAAGDAQAAERAADWAAECGKLLQ